MVNTSFELCSFHLIVLRNYGINLLWNSVNEASSCSAAFGFVPGFDRRFSDGVELCTRFSLAARSLNQIRSAGFLCNHFQLFVELFVEVTYRMPFEHISPFLLTFFSSSNSLTASSQFSFPSSLPPPPPYFGISFPQCSDNEN